MAIKSVSRLAVFLALLVFLAPSFGIAAPSQGAPTFLVDSGGNSTLTIIVVEQGTLAKIPGARVTIGSYYNPYQYPRPVLSPPRPLGNQSRAGGSNSSATYSNAFSSLMGGFLGAIYQAIPRPFVSPVVGNQTRLTSASGAASFNITSGQHVFWVSKEGYSNFSASYKNPYGGRSETIVVSLLSRSSAGGDSQPLTTGNLSYFLPSQERSLFRQCLENSDCACGTNIFTGTCDYGNSDFYSQANLSTSCSNFCYSAKRASGLRCVNSTCVTSLESDCASDCDCACGADQSTGRCATGNKEFLNSSAPSCLVLLSNGSLVQSTAFCASRNASAGGVKVALSCISGKCGYRAYPYGKSPPSCNSTVAPQKPSCSGEGGPCQNICCDGFYCLAGVNTCTKMVGDPVFPENTSCAQIGAPCDKPCCQGLSCSPSSSTCARAVADPILMRNSSVPATNPSRDPIRTQNGAMTCVDDTCTIGNGEIRNCALDSDCACGANYPTNQCAVGPSYSVNSSAASCLILQANETYLSVPTGNYCKGDYLPPSPAGHSMKVACLGGRCSWVDLLKGCYPVNPLSPEFLDSATRIRVRLGGVSSGPVASISATRDQASQSLSLRENSPVTSSLLNATFKAVNISQSLGSATVCVNGLASSSSSNSTSGTVSIPRSPTTVPPRSPGGATPI